MFSFSDRRAALAAVTLAALMLVPLMASAQEDSSPDLAQEISESFRALVLRDGIVLEPLESGLGVNTIELTGGEIIIDGVAVSADELEARLGELAPPVTALFDLDQAGRREALTGIDSSTSTESSPEGVRAGDTEDTGQIEDAEDAEETERSRRRAVRRERQPRGRADNRVVVGSSLLVDEGEVSRDVVVFGGSLTVRGRVIGDAAAIGGSVRVSGEIDGDLAAVGGSIELEEGAEIRGDVVSVGGMVERADGAEVHGQVIQVPFDTALRFGDWNWDSDGPPWHAWRGWRGHQTWSSFSPFGHALKIGWNVVGLGILVLLACLVLLVARAAVERVGRKATDEPWKAGLVGLLAQVLFVPLLVIVCLVLVVSVIGIPLLILVPFAVLGLVVIAFLGYTAVARELGEWLSGRFGWTLKSPYVVLLLGIALLQVWSLIAEVLDFGWGPLWFFAVMFGLFGCLIVYLAWTVGLGAAILTRFGTSPGWGVDTSAAVPAALPAPPAPTGGIEPGARADWDSGFSEETEAENPEEKPED